ncbi:MAG: hypothetical protein CL910_19185 [Deltaproteobacteria bacterium]|jgi:hypothetical protein|nr:hypothetical protein [Deltaproteobacteria bacterium]
MTVAVDEGALLAELAPLLETEACQLGLRNLSSDPFFVAFFLASVSQGEGLGAAAVGMIGQDELAARIRNLDVQEREEREHEERTIDAARSLFPEWFDDAGYRYPEALQGKAYYVEVLERNRERLKEGGRYSRLNLYLTTTFAYEIMVLLLYRAVADAVRSSPLPPEVRERVACMIDAILEEEQGHVGIVRQHQALLETPREGLSDEALGLLDTLAKMSADDYRQPAELAVRHVVSMMECYADAERYRERIQSTPGARS